MRFLGIMVVVDCVLVGRMVRSSHAEVCKHFFGLSNPRQTLTFNEVVLPTNTVVTNQYTSLGMPFSPLVSYSPHTGFPGIVGYDVGNFTLSGNLVDPTTAIHFSQPLTDAACAMAADITTSRGATLCEVLFDPLMARNPVRWGPPRYPNPQLGSSSPSVASACSATAGGASRAPRRAFPSPVP